MRVRIKHVTRYEYDDTVGLGPHTIRLSPAPHVASSVLSYNLKVEPAGKQHWQQDMWANRIARITFEDEVDVRSLHIEVDATFDLQPRNPFDFYVDERCRELPFEYPDGLADEMAPFLERSEIHPAVAEWLSECPPKGYIVDWLVEINRRAAAGLRYLIRTEPGIQTPEETLTLRSGSCRDSAWLLVHVMRAAGLVARFVSGYLIQLEDEGDIPGMARGMTHDVLDLHAWCEVFVPGAGWIGLDATSGLLCGEGHIPLACAVVPELAAPISGTASRAADRFEFTQEVARVGHEPRPRKPYTDEQWVSLLQAGERVDSVLLANNIHMTVGGEPTWTTRENAAEPEWNTDALGPTKWAQALRFTHALQSRLGEGVLGLHRFGKHYPGESLPRWNLHLMWRQDGEPLWKNASRLDFVDRHAANAQQSPADPPRLPATDELLEQARVFAEAVAHELGVQRKAEPVFEDPWVAIRTESELPPDVDPRNYDPDQPEDRRRLASVFRHGLQRPTGFVVPVQAQQSRWVTSEWSVRRGRIYLLPGDSPVGLRLPLDRIGGRPIPSEMADPTVQGRPLPRAGTTRIVLQQQGHSEPAAFASPGETVLTAMAVEPRDGVLHLFVPPVPNLERFVEFVEAAEAAAEKLDVMVRLEGYPPPSDSRVVHCMVTPDPGVIEVNIPPCKSVAEYADILSTLQDAARHAGLWCERFMLDGRAVGSGGGNHITLGGATPLESPFLQRPELLARLVRFFQQHPSLSYLFTGLFVGPTSQAPRVDEARQDSLAELELALHQLHRAGERPAPWFVDRLLRNLLVDLSGNTHRTEICIDKLYNPGSVTGRLGIVELRAFEMPPHERMAVAQVVLVRAIVAALAAAPYDTPLVAWGTRLHDEFMLPYFVWQDFQDVLAFLDSRGVPLDEDWYRVFLDYRFPLFGQIQCEGVTLDIRPALEPWSVLGEEPTGATTSRYVDSSLERIEVRVRGLQAERHALTVNGVLVPLHATSTPGEMVAGIRFRAWQPPHCLHPHIGVHHPLQLDVVDTWAKRSLGGCRYHVWHPEGRAFLEPPLTAVEATARRASRFTILSATPWPVHPVRIPRNPAMRVTLDLRFSQTDRQQEYIEPI